MLHGLIEPAWGKEQLDVAVVGISNWALDAAKMNRAIHLYRPEPDIHLSSHPYLPLALSLCVPRQGEKNVILILR